MPRSLKKSRAFIGMLGICCVTHPMMIRAQSVLDGKTGLYKITNDFSSITVRKDVNSHNAESMRKLWESSNG